MHSRYSLLFSLLMAVMLALAGCTSGPQVRSSSAPGWDFSEARTFSFVPEPSTNRAGYHTIITMQLMFSSRREMELRGFEFVADPAEADLLVNFHTQLDERIRVRNVPDPWAHRGFWDHRTGWYHPWPAHSAWPRSTRVEVDQTTEGMLNIDLIHAGTNMLVWEGVATQQVTARTLSDIGPSLDTAVHAVFQQFPVAVRPLP